MLTPLNTRSQPDVLAFGEARVKTNFAIVDGGLARMAGYRRLLDQTPYCNQDLHDQLINAQFRYGQTTPVTIGASDEEIFPSSKCGSLQLIPEERRSVEYVTLVKQVNTTYGGRMLIVGTQSRLYLLNEYTGNWRLLADALATSTTPR